MPSTDPKASTPGSIPGSVGQSLGTGRLQRQHLSHSHSLWGQSHTYLLALLPRPSWWPLCPLVPWLSRAPSDAWSSTGSCLSLDRMKMTSMTPGSFPAEPGSALHHFPYWENPSFLMGPPCRAQQCQSPGMKMLGGFQTPSMASGACVTLQEWGDPSTTPSTHLLTLGPQLTLCSWCSWWSLQR